jgi:hypothetical protein
MVVIFASVVASAQQPQGNPSPQAYLPGGGVAWVYAAGALASAIASVMAWIAKIRWGQDMERSYKQRLEGKDEIIHAKNQAIEEMTKLKQQTIEARDERLDSLKEVHAAVLKGKEDEITLLLKSKEDQIATLLQSKEGEIAAWKVYSSPDVMNTIKARTEQLHQIVQERDKEIEKLKGHVKERPLDAADLALRAEKLELEKNYLALVQAYQMKASSQSFSDMAVSGEDKGKIESARSFLNQLGSTQQSREVKAAEAEAGGEDADGKDKESESDEDPGGKQKPERGI